MSYLPREIRSWVDEYRGDSKTRVRFRNLADEIQRLEVKADGAKASAALDQIRELCENVDIESDEALQGWLAENIIAVLDGVTARSDVRP